MTIERTDVFEIVGEIWESMLGLQVVEAPDDLSGSEGRDLFAAVQITGSWEGALIIGCREGTAATFTAAMLGLDGEAPAESDVFDVMGELANMAGGNLKAIVGQEARLSLPTVALGSDLDVSIPGADVVVQQGFEAAGSRFRVVVMAKTAPAIAATG